MNTDNEAQDGIYNSAHNPFPEPQTIPSGWDLSGIISTPQIHSDTDENVSLESENL
jgi:hypothetical protein